MRILHTADIHIGADAHGRLDPATGLNSRMADYERSFAFMVERALAEQVDVFLFAGDAYRTADPTPTQQRLFAQALQPVLRAGIPVVMLVGNHDHPVSHGKATALDIFGFLDGQIQVFREPGGPHVIDTPSGPLQLIALPWPARSSYPTPEGLRGKTAPEVAAALEANHLAVLQEALHKANPALPTVLMGHFTVHEAAYAGSERASLLAHEPRFGVKDLALPPIDYVALGHIHRFQNLQAQDSRIPVVYCGSIERVSFGEERETKGFVVADLDPKRPPGERTTQLRFIETPARKFVSIEADLKPFASPTEALVELMERKSLKDAIVRVRYEVTEAQLPLLDQKRIREALGEAALVAAIDRKIEASEGRPRIQVEREASLRDALGFYFERHPELKSIAAALTKEALALEEQLEQGRKGTSAEESPRGNA